MHVILPSHASCCCWQVHAPWIHSSSNPPRYTTTGAPLDRLDFVLPNERLAPLASALSRRALLSAGLVAAAGGPYRGDSNYCSYVGPDHPPPFTQVGSARRPGLQGHEWGSTTKQPWPRARRPGRCLCGRLTLGEPGGTTRLWRWISWMRRRWARAAGVQRAVPASAARPASPSRRPSRSGGPGPSCREERKGPPRHRRRRQLPRLRRWEMGRRSSRR